MTENLDLNLYSRQIGTIGIDTMKKLVNLKILIIGLRGLGIEIAKNIILAGPNQVSIFDPEIVKINDLGSNFYLSENDVENKKRRDEACIKKLSELNPYVKCDIMEGMDIISQIKNFNVIVITEITGIEKLNKLNEECRKNNIGFIYALALGITAVCFVDFGEHKISDSNGEEIKTYFIKNISNKGEIFIDKSASNKYFGLSKKDYVIFREINGINELNDGKPREIIKSTPLSFFISDKLKYENYISGGICEEVKQTITKKYDSIKDKLFIPYNEEKPLPFDLSKIGRNELIHCGIIALHKFYENHNNSLPELNDSKSANEILEIAKEIYENAKAEKQKWVDNIKKWEDKIILNIANWAKSEISPICSFLGGIAAQEIIKYTGKYTPINQWFWFEDSETVENLPIDIDRSLKNSRYDDQIAIFGNNIQEKLSNLNIFMIGAGALGCEYLKIFSLMGISTNENKKVIVTDNDNIEISNLNRQFLFRKGDVGKSKSKCACIEAKKINKSFNCLDKQSRIGQENEDIFDEKFWNEQSYIINAVDNFEARKYIDNQCTFYEKPLIESGTLGTIAHIQTIIPHVTICYNDSKRTDTNPLDSIPVCTLHNFPSMIEHCIEWGKELFNTLFTENIVQLKNWMENKEQFYQKIETEDIFTQLESLNNIKNHILIIESNNFDKCIESAVKIYTENFDHKICKLINDYPENHLNEDGSKFWSGSKRFPKPIKYDADNELCFTFVKSYSIIIARILSIPIKNDDEYIKSVSKKVEIPKFNPKSENKNSILNNCDDIELLMEKILQEEEDTEISTIKQEIEGINIEQKIIEPEKFEKDDDLNGHIDFIYSCSNIRARNYNIKEIEKQKVKIIAGRIIPAMATTTATITGIACLQLYTLNQTNNINYFRNCYLNLAINRFIMTMPSEQIMNTDQEYYEDIDGPVKAIPPNWTVWDKIIIKGSKTVEELIKYIETEYKVKIFFIKSKDITIYQNIVSFTNEENAKLKIEDIFSKEAIKKDIKVNNNFLILKISSEYENIPVIMPLFKYIYKN